jgi:hypothetical protein
MSSGLGFTIQKGDSIDAVVNRVIFAFVVHYALIHQREVVGNTNQIGALWVLGLIIFLYYVEGEVAKIVDPGLLGLKSFLSIMLTIYQTYLHYLLLAITDSLLADTVVDGPLSFILLSRPIALSTIAAGLLALLKIYYGKDKKNKEKK